MAVPAAGGGGRHPVSQCRPQLPWATRLSLFLTLWRTKAASFSPRPLQEFFYAGPREELAQKTLLVSVWDYDLGTADDFIGEWECGGAESGGGGLPHGS